MDWTNILYSIPAVVIGLTIHEYCHAFVAHILGDSTAKDEGRLTLNPLRHIDPLGMLFIVIAGFGWARPVRFTPQNLGHPRRDRALIALAGPVSNLLLGMAVLLLLKAAMLFEHLVSDGVYRMAAFELYYIAAINIGLFVFNMLPLPPLDGSHVAFSGADISRETETRLMKYGSYALFALLFFGSRTGVNLLPIGAITAHIIKLIL
jgi:Zn-dependent protease